MQRDSKDNQQPVLVAQDPTKTANHMEEEPMSTPRTVLIRRNSQGYAFDVSGMPGEAEAKDKFKTVWIPLPIPPDVEPQEVINLMEEETGDHFVIITQEEGGII